MITRTKIGCFRKGLFPLWITGATLLLFSCDKTKETPEPIDKEPTPVSWKKPDHFPDPVYDLSRNPLTEEGIELGRFLFYDGILSRTNKIGCGTCHQPQVAFTHHGHELSHGVDDLLGTRNAPSTQNLAWSPVFFWDGGVHDLDFVPFNPIANPVEMDETVPNILDKLRASPHNGSGTKVDYPNMFKKAFGTEEINTERMMKALSQFMMTMVSATSQYDFYLMGDQSALNPLEKEGMLLFEQKCSSCHSGVLQTDHSFRNNGLMPLRINDQGRFNVSTRTEDKYKFKVPSLRNVGVTNPYMHDGRYHTLEEVLDHYSRNIAHFYHSGSEAVETLDPLLANPANPGIPMTQDEKKAIIAFLHTLTDEIFNSNPQLKDPGVGNAF